MKLSRSQIIELAVVIILLGTALFVRSYHLNADPPVGLSISDDVYTDHGQYTLFAKQKIETGNFNPYNDNRFAFFLKSSVTVLSFLFFKMFGVSLTVSNAVGLFYSFGSLLLMFLIVRKSENSLASIIYLVLIIFNYNQLFYGRLPFLEHAMTFYGFLGLTLLLYCPRMFGYILAGLSLGVGIFFGKIIGAVFMAPFAVYLFYRWYVEKEIKFWHLLFFAGGFSATLIFWLFFSYLPMKEQVAGYVGEQAFSLYGSPESLESLDNFIWKLVTLGYDSRMFERMVVPIYFGICFIGLVIYRLINKDILKEKMKKLNSTHLFIAVAIVAFYFSLMIWNYRPLRYQLVLIYLVTAGASVVISRIISKVKVVEIEKKKVPYWFIVPLFFMIFILVYQSFGKILEISGYSDYSYDNYKYITAAWSALITVAVYYFMRLYYQEGFEKIVPFLRYPIIVLVLIVMITGAVRYFSWMPRATYTIEDINRELPMLIGSNAVVSGPYAPLLTINNDLGTIIHMFGVSQADPELFKKYPMTHLLMDAGNKIEAKKDYPGIIDSAVLMTTYRVGENVVDLYRLAEFSENREAKNYIETPYELFLDEYIISGGDFDRNKLIRLVQMIPSNMSLYSLMAEEAEKDGEETLAETMYKKAVEFSPTNYHLIARFAKFYENQYRVNNNKRYIKQAIELYEKALFYSPDNKKLVNSLELLQKKLKK